MNDRTAPISVAQPKLVTSRKRTSCPRGIPRPSDGQVLILQKAATIGIPLLVAIAAPTTMALRIAEKTGITLVALARSDSVTVYANPGRIRETAAEPQLSEV